MTCIHCLLLSLRYSHVSMHASIMSLLFVRVACLFFTCSGCAASLGEARNEGSVQVVLDLNAEKSLEYINEWVNSEPYGFKAGLASLITVEPKKVRLHLGRSEILNYFQARHSEFRERVDNLLKHGAQITSDVAGLNLAATPAWQGSAEFKELDDISLLAHFKNLEYLNLSYTKVEDLKPIAGLEKLKSLLLVNTGVKDIKPLAKLKKLESLILANTDVESIEPLAELDNLMWLSLTCTQVKSVKPLAGLKKMIWLMLSGTQVEDIAPLQDLEKLQTLDLSGTQVLRFGLWPKPDPTARRSSDLILKKLEERNVNILWESPY